MMDYHTEISPNGVHHEVDENGRCNTCGKDHRDWYPLPPRLRTCWCGGRISPTRLPNGEPGYRCLDSEFHDPTSDGRPAGSRILYLSGPMSGYPECNYPAFRDAATSLRAAGYTVMDPSEVATPASHYTDLLKEDIRILLDCDGVAVMDRWWESTGARCEVQVAGVVRIPVRSVAEWLTRWGDDCTCLPYVGGGTAVDNPDCRVHHP